MTEVYVYLILFFLLLLLFFFLLPTPLLFSFTQANSHCCVDSREEKINISKTKIYQKQSVTFTYLTLLTLPLLFLFFVRFFLPSFSCRVVVVWFGLVWISIQFKFTDLQSSSFQVIRFVIAAFLYLYLTFIAYFNLSYSWSGGRGEEQTNEFKGWGGKEKESMGCNGMGRMVFHLLDRFSSDKYMHGSLNGRR